MARPEAGRQQDLAGGGHQLCPGGEEHAVAAYDEGAVQGRELLDRLRQLGVEEVAFLLRIPLERVEDQAARLAAALAVTDIASVLIAPAPGVALDAAAARPLVELTQQRNVAALIADDAGLARTLRADGVHISARKDIMQAFEEARGIVGRSAVVGVDVGLSRHDAMTLAESEADYVAFGAFFPSTTKAVTTPADIEIIAWWSSLMELPCVAIGGITVDNCGTRRRRLPGRRRRRMEP